MDCIEYRALMSAVLDGEATEAEDAELRRHISGCPGCAALWNAMSAVCGQLRDMTVAPPDTLAPGIMYRIKNVKKRRFALFGRFTAIAAAAIAIAVAGRYVLPSLMPAESAAPKAAYEDSAADSSAPDYDEAEAYSNELTASAGDTEAAADDDGQDGGAAENDIHITAGSLMSLGVISRSAGFADTLEDADAWLGVYVIDGDAPAELADYTPTETEDGALRYEAPARVVTELENAGAFSEIQYLNGSAENGIILVYPQ